MAAHRQQQGGQSTPRRSGGSSGPSRQEIRGDGAEVKDFTPSRDVARARLDRTVTTDAGDVPAPSGTTMLKAPQSIRASITVMPGHEANCLPQALRHVPGAPPNPAEAANLRGTLGSTLMKHADETASGHAGENYRSWVENSEGMSLKAYTDKAYSRKSRVHLGAIELDLFVTFIEPGTLVAVYEEPGGAPLKNGEEYDLTLRGIFHDGVSPITEVKLLARSSGPVRDTGHYDVATRVVDSDWTPARRGALLTSTGTSARTPARTSARAPRPDF